MKRKLFIAILISGSYLGLQAQVTIGSNYTPSPNALLDLKEKADSTSTKGLLLPRVALTATNSPAPLSAHVAGMTVYNTATAGTAPTNVTPGYYYNDGSKWVRLADATSIPSAWLLGGNTNGVLKTIGTNDAYDFPVTVKATEAMRAIWDGTNNVTRVAVGTTAAATVASSSSSSSAVQQLAKFTVAGGDGSINGITLGMGGGQVSSNTALGGDALKNNVNGYGNSAVGSGALSANTTGVNNTAMGVSSLEYNTSASGNTAFGSSALSANTTGFYNVAIGASSLNKNITGTDNTAVGVYTGNNLNSDNNTLVGANAGSNMTTGGNNTLIGYRAGYTTNGGSNTLIGYRAGYNITTGSNNIAIGANVDMASNTASNQLNIGNTIFGTGMTGDIGTPAGNIGINNTAPAQALDVKGNVQFSGALMPAGDAGTSGYVLTSKGTDIAPVWSRNQLTKVVGALSTTNTTITATNLDFGVSTPNPASYLSNNSVYTGSYITLPKGRWMVNVVMLLNTVNDVFTPSGFNAWITGAFCESSTTYAPLPDAYKVNTNFIVGGTMTPNNGLSMMNGFILINNSTASDKTFYFWLRQVILYKTTAAGASSFTLQGFGTTRWGENQIVAFPID